MTDRPRCAWVLLQEVRSVKAVVVLLVDLLDASGTLMSKVRGTRCCSRSRSCNVGVCCSNRSCRSDG